MGIVVRKTKRVMVGTGGKQFYDVVWNGKLIDSVPRSEVSSVRKRIKAEDARNKRLNAQDALRKKRFASKDWKF